MKDNQFDLRYLLQHLKQNPKQRNYENDRFIFNEICSNVYLMNEIKKNIHIKGTILEHLQIANDDYNDPIRNDVIYNIIY